MRGDKKYDIITYHTAFLEIFFRGKRCVPGKDAGAAMRILGIDPGYAIVGYGVVDYDGMKFTTASFGAITTQAGEEFCYRLQTIYHDMNTLLETCRPELMAIEKLFFNTNQKTGIDVSQARGVILLAAAEHGVEVAEYTPLQVKQAVVGYGKAEKKQVMEMTRKILGLPKVPKPDDTADALAMAICGGHSAHSSRQLRLAKSLVQERK